MTDSYESEALLGQYLDFHYRSTDPDYLPHHPLPEGVVDYPRRCAEVPLKSATRFGRALDLGCAVGGSSFALATRFEEVVGIDFSQAFINAARELAEIGRFRHSEVTYTPYSDARNCTPTFQWGNACDLPEDLGTFDTILMANLLCRLPDPSRCLDGLRRHTHSGSLLFFTTPCSWDEAFTPREKWLQPTLESLHSHLDPWCECLDTFDMPFVLRDHPRRAQFTIAQASLWRVR